MTLMEQSLSQAGTYLPIEDHGIIGDLHTVALVGKNGTIDWCCMPSFDAPSIFGSLLDADKGGFFSIAPYTTPELAHKQYYLPETNILITRFFTLEGVGEVTDFMPIQSAKEHTKHTASFAQCALCVANSLLSSSVARRLIMHAIRIPSSFRNGEQSFSIKI